VDASASVVEIVGLVRALIPGWKKRKDALSLENADHCGQRKGSEVPSEKYDLIGKNPTAYQNDLLRAA
jgi:hypothetical protein